MVEYLLTICIIFVILYALIKGCSVDINISVKQEFSAEDRQLLEDVFNKDGDLRSELDVQESIDNAIQAINDIMLDQEDTNG